MSGWSEVDVGDVSCVYEDEDGPITIPLPGAMTLEVIDKEEALFISAEWTLIASVGDRELQRSTASKQPHTEPYKKRWTRQLIRNNVARLKRLGVDVEETYVKWGGLLSDLSDD